jgi:hypothetical protein
MAATYPLTEAHRLTLARVFSKVPNSDVSIDGAAEFLRRAHLASGGEVLI